MNRTNADNQEVSLREKIRTFFTKTMKKHQDDPCPVKNMLATSLDKWSLFVMYNLGYHRVMRFNELKNRIDGISSRMLSITLKRLEQNGLVSRKVYAEVPPRVEYRLTEFGQAFTDKRIATSRGKADGGQQNHCH